MSSNPAGTIVGDMFTYPAAPGWKVSGASKDAAEAMAPNVSRIRTRVLSCINRHPTGITTDECAATLGLSILTVRPRFSELHREGVIEKSGERRKNASGMSAHVWRPCRAS